MSLGEQLKSLRQAKQFSQPELAELAGIEQSYLSKLENDKAQPSNDMLRKLIAALEIGLEELLRKLPTTSVQKLASLPDVEQWLNKQNQQQFSQRRNYLLVSSALIVFAITLFFTGYSKLIFSEQHYEYVSDGVVRDGEIKTIFDDWPKLIQRGQKESRELHEKKAIEMASRKSVEYLRVDSWLGDPIEKPVDGGTRYYWHSQMVDQAQPINAWLQVCGVFLFAAGVMGFVIERKLLR
ncbi:helix-turn-helix domain-containing protein [Thalassotalea euphylliae]|uniref:XRE family transcriptional regulator n=1 Tax=Thalassotalea euphylliae TaxID=1655234 RepID=A0A3E0U2K2_9GAMM|nr:helix-turn-helix transcriptional regulator [Thalassotalea euphylliae]REL31211.1 XRE family transcriptional regulator [Thalassotalea euphylliae]